MYILAKSKQAGKEKSLLMKKNYSIVCLFEKVCTFALANNKRVDKLIEIVQWCKVATTDSGVLLVQVRALVEQRKACHSFE